MNKVKNTDFLKDTQTGVIVNANNKDYINARSRITKQKMKDKKITDLQSEVSELRDGMKKLLAIMGNNE